MPSTDADTLIRLPATTLAAMIARREVSSAEAVEAHIARIEQVDPLLNAVVVKRYEAARAEAREADRRVASGAELGALHGVPLTIKECIDLEGTPSTFGLPALAAKLAAHDDPSVGRLRAAGAIILGKTNVSQLLLFIEADNPVYGRTNNPWNLARTSGGSSGGQAAIIAAGGSPMGLGTDIGGSVRCPATFCGVAGLKPTAGRIPDPGRYSVPFGQRAIVSQIGVLARTVGDVALGLEIINGGRNPAAEPPLPLGDPTSVSVAQLRIGYYVDDGTFAVAPAVARAVGEAAHVLRELGARVTPWSPPDVPRALDLFFAILAADGGRGMKDIIGGDPRDPRIASLAFLAGRSRATLAVLRGVLGLLGQRRLAAPLRNFGHRDTYHYWKLVDEQMAYGRRFAQAMDAAEGGPLDLLLCPASALPALTHGSSRELTTAGAYAPLYNVLGYPAGVVPFTRVRAGEEVGRRKSRDLVEETARKVEQGSAGLPVGVQLVGRPWREHVVLAAMRAVEEATATRADRPGMAEPRAAAEPR